VKFSVVFYLPAVIVSLFGQDRPQLVWQGEVEGVATLYIKGKRVETQERRGSAVRQHFHFYHRLPDSSLDARLETIGGRGYVHILEQPRVDNDYTLAVRIEDQQTGSAPYSLAFYWDTSSDRMENLRDFSRGGRLTWKGRVDDEVVVSCRQSTCEANAANGQQVLHEDYKFSKPLPASEVEVNLEKNEGRGEIRLLEPPLEKNNYTARVLIRDPEAGASDYSFTLTWARPSKSETQQQPAQAGLIWRGRVDGRIRVTVRGGATASEVLAGKPLIGQGTDFYRPLPSRSDVNITLKKLNGRGQARIIQLPTAQNHFELAFEIENGEAGPDDYQIEVDW
jgi:hypothetical protein